MYGLEIIIISVFWTITLILIRLIFEIIFPNKLSFQILIELILMLLSKIQRL
jgi:hypothetical protein